jgi:hypothetical protein
MNLKTCHLYLSSAILPFLILDLLKVYFQAVFDWISFLIADFHSYCTAMDYSIKRTGHFDVPYVGHVFFFALAVEKAQKNKK